METRGASFQAGGGPRHLSDAILTRHMQAVRQSHATAIMHGRLNGRRAHGMQTMNAIIPAPSALRRSGAGRIIVRN